MDEIIRYVRKMRSLFENELSEGPWWDELQDRLDLARKGVACTSSTTAPKLGASLNEQQVKEFGQVEI
jgi:hypothetical protein